jgi:hypothetical protein
VPYPPPLQTWNSPFLASILNTNHHFLACMFYTPFLSPLYALFIASYPAREGGVGLQDPTTNAIASYIIPLSRSIHYAEQGIHFQSQDLKLAPFYANSLCNWKAEPLRLFTIFCHYLPQTLTTLARPPDAPPTPAEFIKAPPRQNIMRNLYHTRANLTPTFQPHVQIILPQLLDKHT